MELDFDVVDLPEADHVAEGDEAPDFTRPLVNEEYWADASLSDLTEEGPVLLVFYTMDGAFPATYIWNEIRDREWGERFDAQVVGVSISDPYAHKQLIEERGMDYDLFSDPGNGVGKAYGIENPLDGMAGISEPRPAVFLVDADRTVEYAWVAQQWPDFPDYDAVEAALEGY
ncbi:redoxin domain-containing protein [Haloarchaeobius sp. HME9146]|uniref:redoxin domain-containing protein n=1 Tax=Haloarchaeobius sp. HME9146 TaxID=2978732 RepID=UPI0021C15A4E|nr:redoxin domain-containing protein [Haloarchaeobius sp. HME9146]MCT9094735.1 redoxin domain-containing protein [Haloarchaeobius sp. HME9146]